MSRISVPRVAVIIPAAGSGKRMGLTENKVLLKVGGEPGLLHLIKLFSSISSVQRLIVLVKKDQFTRVNKILSPLNFPGFTLLEGGAERQDSVRIGLEYLKDEPPDWVLIHDGARPLVTPDLVQRVLQGLQEYSSVVPALPITDTVRKRSGTATQVIPRDGLYQVQTPQGFHWTPLWEAHQTAFKTGFVGTDDAQLLENTGISTHLVPGEFSNIKLTVAKDALLAEVFFRLRQE